MKILLFTEGTILAHSSSEGKTREEIVKQVINEEQSVHDYQNYIPVKSAVQSVKKLKDDGHEICYLTSRKTDDEINDIQKVLKKYDFPDGQLFYRKEDEEYKDVIKRVKPDVIIEDDCESIGGYNETILSQLGGKTNFNCIVVEEFGGIDNIKI